MNELPTHAGGETEAWSSQAFHWGLWQDGGWNPLPALKSVLLLTRVDPTEEVGRTPSFLEEEMRPAPSLEWRWPLLPRDLPW